MGLQFQIYFTNSCALLCLLLLTICNWKQVQCQKVWPRCCPECFCWGHSAWTSFQSLLSVAVVIFQNLEFYKLLMFDYLTPRILFSGLNCLGERAALYIFCLKLNWVLDQCYMCLGRILLRNREKGRCLSWHHFEINGTLQRLATAIHGDFCLRALVEQSPQMNSSSVQSYSLANCKPLHSHL